jgi:glycogen debranching enzyme
LDEVIRVKEEFYVLATSALADSRPRVLKYGDTCGVFDWHGDILSGGSLAHGLYHQETRHLSRLVLRFENKPLELLSSTVKNKNSFFAVDLTNLDLSADGRLELPRGSIHFFRSKFIWQGICYERLRLMNFASAKVRLSLCYEYDADFVDIFEVRGSKREQRGHCQEATVSPSSVRLAYCGLDKVVRETTLNFYPQPAVISPKSANFELEVQPRAEAFIYLDVCCQQQVSLPAPSWDATGQESAGPRHAPSFRMVGQECLPPRSYRQALTETKNLHEKIDADLCRVTSSNPRFNDWLLRSQADLEMMTVGNPEGAYPYAGVPWFNTVFGRDGLITAYEVLWAEPGLAKGVLRFLAATQADSVVPEQDAQPGKILHELRKGEMAALKEIPFGRYYGSVDSTPLFIMLAAAYYERTADLEFITSIWSNIQRALDWMDRHGDLDGDGFLEYARHSGKGLIQQGWKDSHDSVFHADGKLAEPPIALCEAQGYAYAARRGAAELARKLGLTGLAQRLDHQADVLKERFEQAFWVEELGSYAFALDGNKRQCRVTVSNPGHCLFTRIVCAERAHRVAEGLMEENLFSGWGVRTVGTREARYNPMSYHNGSVWPHDNALIGLGLAHYGLTGYALRLLESMFEASLHFEFQRLPELFCGFRRRIGDGPTLYPVACSPQSWAAAAVFMLLQASLGMTVSGTAPSIRFHDSHLPPAVDHVMVENLRVGKSKVSLIVRRQTHGVGIEVIRRDGDLEVAVLK